MAESLTYSESIFVNASPEEVYATVSDITRTGEWSPVCKESWWDEGDGPRVGAYFTGRNVTAERTWETRCRVIEAESGQAFLWTVNDGWSIWGYRMKAVEGGTELTETWEFTSEGQEGFVGRFGAEAAPVEIEKRRQAAHAGIPETLAALKKVIEG